MTHFCYSDWMARVASEQLELEGVESRASSPTRSPDPGERNARTADRAAAKQSDGLPRLSVSPGEAAAMLGVSRDYFDEHVIHDLRIVRRGRRILVALSELERWLDRNAARATITTTA
jgi:excisionase family DNA binding protein